MVKFGKTEVVRERFYAKNLQKFGMLMLITCGLNVPEDDKEYESFTAIPIDFLIVYENKYWTIVLIKL